ncbi:MAG: hypothetical protein JNL10_17660 [Verrucomicrobiales bacterium]|nr:hypothetical protein [Verrucomicrobiales bacterium]
MMTVVRGLLAALPDASLLPNALPTQTRDSLRGVLPVMVAVLAVVVVVVFWAVFLRKSPATRRRGYLVDGDAPGGRHSSSGRRRRRRRREHRTSNPTRAETGGLPPAGAGGTGSTVL